MNNFQTAIEIAQQHLTMKQVGGNERFWASASLDEGDHLVLIHQVAPDNVYYRDQIIIEVRNEYRESLASVSISDTSPVLSSNILIHVISAMLPYVVS